MNGKTWIDGAIVRALGRLRKKMDAKALLSSFARSFVSMGSILVGLLVVIAVAAVAVFAFWVTLPWTIRPLLRLVLWPRYRLRVIGREGVPKEGPVLFAANHASWFDGFFLAATSPRQGKALVSADVIGHPVVRTFAVRSGMIPTPFHGAKAIRGAIEATRKVLENRDAIGIFPEGQISRNGLTGPFHRGLEVMIKGVPDVVVVPVAIDNVWGSLSSYAGGRFWTKRPRGVRRTINMVYAKPIAPPVTAFAVRQALQEALVRAYAMRPKPRTLPETINLTLPHWQDPELGLLTASTADVDLPEIHFHQAGQKAGTVGMVVPGVALRAVDAEGNELPADTEGGLEALVADRPDWTATGKRGRIHSDGFVELIEA